MRIRLFRRPGRKASALGWLVVPVMACAPLPGPGPVSAQGQVDPGPGLAARAVLDSILSSSPLGRAHWGVAVYDLQTGAPVLLHDSDRLFIAASTMKLATAVAALDLLGPDYRFETRVAAVLDSSGAASSLTVVGGGDPSLGAPFHTNPLSPLDSLADSLAAAGLRRVDGPIVVDQSWFDSVMVNPAWETFDLDWYYAAPVAPLAVMASSFEVVVTPTAVGELARAQVPVGSGLVNLDARIRTVTGTSRWDDQLRRLPRGDSLILRGAIGAGAGPDTSWIAQTDPGRTAGLALQEALERHGIPVTGPVSVRYTAGSPAGTARGVPDPASQPSSGSRAVVWRSPPLQAIIRVALERSDNWVTEQILKTLGASLAGQGSWGAGTVAVERYLARQVSVPPDAIYMRDGSGLTPQGLLTPHTVTTLLRYADGRPWGAAFRSALASPGEQESTLEDRLPGYGDLVAAKTGTLRHVNALSGYLRTVGGKDLVFSILSNGSGQPSWKVQEAVDRIVESLLENGS